ncbi:MAG TPA: caspase family protein [Acetobacteraceae bacterium]|nr:caspase family protein [Acetobacteraceae bacterium]
MRASRLLSFMAAFLGLVLCHAQAGAQPTRQLVPVPFNSDTPVALAVSLDQKQPRIGSTVSICFEASRAGYATLWNIATNNTVTRVFPNRFGQPGAAAQVEAARRYCAGSSGDPFRFRVDGPAGTEDLYLLWTTRPELQPAGSDYADAAALVGDMRRLAGANANDWGSTKLTYDIIPATPPPPPPLPDQGVSGSPSDGSSQPGTPAPKVWVFAMGANVSGLTKSNQDAAYFTRALTGLFGLTPDKIRITENGKNEDFRSGMAWLRRVAQPRDFVFIYFSGHGGRFRSNSSDDGWDEYLVPYDFEAPHPDPKNLLFSQVIAALVNQLPTKNVVAVVDACHSAGVFRSIEAAVLGARSKFYQVPPEMSAQLEQIQDSQLPQTRAMSGRGRIKANGLLLAAAHRDQNALEGSRGSFFTLALVQEMLSKEGGTLADAFTRSIATTAKMTENRQEPEAVGDTTVARNVVFGP